MRVTSYLHNHEALEPAALRDALRRDAEALARKLAPQRRLPVQARLPLSEQTPPLFRKQGREGS